MGQVSKRITAKLQQAFQPSLLELADDSARHAGHAAMKGLAAEETHFTITISAASLAGKSRVMQHRAIYDLLKDELQEHGGTVHALAIKVQ